MRAPAGRRRVLVTGATGYIAGQLLPAFRERYDLVLLDARTTDRQGRPVEGVIVADLRSTDLDALRPHFAGVDTVVHLAYYRPNGPVGAGHTYYDERVNVDMAYHVYQLSFDAGVRRVVMASSNHACDWYEHLLRARKLDMVYPDTYPLSDNYYGWAKIAYEHLGFIFACGALGRKMGVVQIRIGAPREIVAERFQGNPVGYKRDLGAYISQRDLQQLFIKSIETENIANEYGIPFQIFYGISGNTRAFWSIANARRVIGYEPEDDSEVKYADDIRRMLIEPGLGGRL